MSFVLVYCQRYIFDFPGEENTPDLDPFHDENGDIKMVGKPLQAEDSKDSFGEKEDGDLEESSDQDSDDEDDEEDNQQVDEIEDLPAEAQQVEDESPLDKETETLRDTETTTTQKSADSKENEVLANNNDNGDDDDDDEDEVLRDIGTSTEENWKNDEV